MIWCPFQHRARFFLAVGNLTWISPRTFHRKNMEKPLWPFMNQPAIWLSNTAGEYPEKNGHFDAENDHGNHDDQRNTPMYTYMILYA